MENVQSQDLQDMVSSIVPRHESPVAVQDPHFKYFQSFQPLNVLRDGRNIYMLFDTTACRLTEKSVIDDLDLSTAGIVVRSCEFNAFARIMVHVRHGVVVDVDQIDGSLRLFNEFIHILVNAHLVNPLLHDIDLRSPLGFRKTYRIYFLKPAIQRRKLRASDECVRQIMDQVKDETPFQAIIMQSTHTYGYITEGSMCSPQLEAARDIGTVGGKEVSAIFNDINRVRQLKFSEYVFSTTTLSSLSDNFLAGVTLLAEQDVSRNVSLGRTLSELAEEQTVSSLRTNELHEQTVYGFAISYKHCVTSDWRNRIGFEQTNHLILLLKEVIHHSQRSGFGGVVAVWSDLSLRVRITSRYKFWPLYGLEPFARFTSIAATPTVLRESDRRTDRVWLYLETFLANQSGGCIMLDGANFVRRCRWRDDLSVNQSLHNLAVHLIQHNLLSKREAADWADKEALQAWVHALLGMRPGAWADLCGRMVNVMQVVEAEITTLPMYNYRERWRTRSGLESSFVSHLLYNMAGSWLAADRDKIRRIDKKFEEVSETYRCTFSYDMTVEGTKEERGFIIPLGNEPSRELIFNRRDEVFFWRRNRYEEFGFMYQRLYDREEREAIMYRVMRMTGRCYIGAAASASETAKRKPDLFAEIMGGVRGEE